MHNIIFPSKDATIYSKYPNINTGLDEILEISKEVLSSNYFYRGDWKVETYYKKNDYVRIPNGPTTYDYYYAIVENIGDNPTTSTHWVKFEPEALTENSRILIQFDLSQLDPTASNLAEVVYLNLYTSIAKKVPIEYTLYAYPLTSSWEMGTGNFTNKLTSDGVTWLAKSSVDDWYLKGGDYNSNVSASQYFNFEPTDIRMDITNIFNYWKTSENNGMIIKRPDVQESNLINYGSLSFYSLETHTVYLPTLEILYDDYIYNEPNVSGSLISGSINIYMKNLMPIYRYNEKVRFSVLVKPAYQAKTFYEKAKIGEIYYLSNGSLKYSIRDAYSNRIIIPFSDYTKVSLNENGYFFDIILSGFMPERFYKILFKYTENGVTQYFDTNSQFKVVK